VQPQAGALVAAAQPQELQPPELQPPEPQPQPLPLLLFAARRRQNACDVSAIATNVTIPARAITPILHTFLLAITHLLE
jgi:hypothetical protein